MQHNTPQDIINLKLQLDQQLLEKLKALGIVKTPSELSLALGKNGTYFACMRRRQYGLHVGSLALFAARLANQLKASANVRERAKLRTALGLVNDIIAEKCGLRELELFG